MSIIDLLDGGKGRFFNCLWGADKCDNGAVGSGTGVDIQQSNPVDSLDCIGNLGDDGSVATFAEVGNTLYELHETSC